jgi:hypothetical protein
MDEEEPEIRRLLSALSYLMMEARTRVQLCDRVRAFGAWG